MSSSQDQTAAFIRDHDAQGEHRCGSDVDMASAHWLASSIEGFGAEPKDRWPEAVDIGRTEAIGQAIAQMCISAAN